MSTRTPVAGLHEHVGSTVSIAGWVHRRRVLKSVSFLVIRDRTGTAQAVFATPPDVTEETVVRLTGRVVTSPYGVELREPTLEVLSEAVKRPPFDLYRPTVPATLPVILDNAAAALRHPLLRKRFELAAASVAAFRRALDTRGFTEIHTPKIVSTATESGANVFQLDYFGRPAYLAQSPQFYKQAMVGVFERVYEVGPVFRAEPHDTARHLAQYTSLDAELGFITDHRDVMAVLRDVIAEMATAAGPDAPSVPAEIPSLDFAAAQELLAHHTDEDPRGEPDLAPAHERWLCNWAAREHGSEFLFVTGYPMAKRPFYTHPAPTDPTKSNSFDLLFRGLELVTGGQRRHRYADYLTALGDTADQYNLDAFAYGMPPHGGFAIGLERWVAQVLDVPNIRSTTLFPRDLHRLTP
ncbi:aspartate--tRNA(Asn) ligase [Amycolatopsis jejuensis]|uniref:aspartate--tRNA(Asn) ligase n=1 Tax=Amycolatopsis jejuensis TaxID=330084 RepID=UPI00052407EE|nr:aspartate--tRNA(Asn) ligase [Amycolatopsis jejuensis]